MHAKQVYKENYYENYANIIRKSKKKMKGMNLSTLKMFWLNVNTYTQINLFLTFWCHMDW